MVIKRLIFITAILLFALVLLEYGHARGQCKREIILSGKDLGSIENPVKCYMPEGEQQYLERLRDRPGNEVKFRRVGHAHPETKGHILDKFEIKSADGSTCAIIYMDMYCPNCVETNPIKGFKMAGPAKTKKKKRKRPDSKTAYKFKTPAITATHVYRMIIKNGFYCEIDKGSGLHGEAISMLKNNGFNIPKYSFKGSRIVTAVKTEDNYIKTQSAKRNTEKIELVWGPRKGYCSFDEALRRINALNSRWEAGKKNRTWRLPTIMELFSIVQENAKNRFHKMFNFPQNSTLTFWTSTPVKKEGTVLEYSKENQAYFVIQSRYNKKSGSYSLSFSFQEIDGKKRKKAFLLPVSSKRVYDGLPVAAKKAPESKPVAKHSVDDSDNIPGFDDPVVVPSKPANNKSSSTPRTSKKPSTEKKKDKPPVIDKIPGFDDVPDPKKKKPAIKAQPPKKTGNLKTPGFDNKKPLQPKHTNTKPPRTVKVALLPYMWKGMAGSQDEDFLNNLNGKISRGLYSLGKKLKRDLNVILEIDKMDSFAPLQMSMINNFYGIISDSSIKDAEKLNTLKSAIMKPRGIDIIVTVEHTLTKNSGIEIFSPIIIDGFDNKIVPLDNTIQNQGVRFLDRIKKRIQEKVLKIIYKKYRGEKNAPVSI